MPDDSLEGPAFATVADMNADGAPDLVVSTFGYMDLPEIPAGAVTIFEQYGANAWQKRPVFGPDAGIRWPNDVHAEDLDGDGDLDVVVGAGFLVCLFVASVGHCGALLWFEQTDDGGFERRDIVPPGSELFYHSGVLGVLADLDGDGDLDLAGAEFFAGLGASFAWYEQLATNRWRRHVIDAGVGPAIQLSLIDDLLGDGRLFAVGTNHVNTQRTPADPWPSAVYVYEVPDDPAGATWPGWAVSRHIRSLAGPPTSRQAAPGIFGHGDADGDGDIDLLVSGDGDPRVFLLEQGEPGRFDTWVLEGDLTQAGGMRIADLDGDGRAELVVSGYDDGVLYLYRHDPQGAYPLGLAQPLSEAAAPADEPAPVPPPATAPPEEEAPGGSPGRVVVTVAYVGQDAGSVIVGLFEQLPPSGPPIRFTTVTAEAFPVDAPIEGVPPGEWQALAFLDLPPLGPTFPGPEDPVGESEAFGVDGDEVAVEVTLAMP